MLNCNTFLDVRSSWIRIPEKEADLQTLARVDHSVVTLVGQGITLTGSQRKDMKDIIVHILETFPTLCV